MKHANKNKKFDMWLGDVMFTAMAGLLFMFAGMLINDSRQHSVFLMMLLVLLALMMDFIAKSFYHREKKIKER